MAGRIDREEVIRAQREIYNRSWLNYGMPLAWESLYKDRASLEFVQWMNEYVIVQ